ncbi:MAG: DUF4199 domain-containing protein [Brumimicrobium sp.]|nr:DUF4199 domain-containing protein [Brumimicrobium sp.]
MLRPTIKIAFAFAFGWIILKMLFYSLHLFMDDIVVPGMINNLFLLLSISLGLYYTKKQEGYGVASAFTDLKRGITSGMIYTLIVAVFILIYYSYIYPEFTENRIEQRMDLFYSEMERPSYVDSLRSQNAAFEIMTKEEIISKIKADNVSNLSPKNSFVFTLLGMMILSATYAIFITLIYQRILFRDSYSEKKGN